MIMRDVVTAKERLSFAQPKLVTNYIVEVELFISCVILFIYTMSIS